jgi:hypothetical protein
VFVDGDEQGRVGYLSFAGPTLAERSGRSALARPYSRIRRLDLIERILVGERRRAAGTNHRSPPAVAEHRAPLGSVLAMGAYSPRRTLALGVVLAKTRARPRVALGRFLRGGKAGQPVAGAVVGVLELGEPYARPGTVHALVMHKPLAVIVDLRPDLGESIRALVG